MMEMERIPYKHRDVSVVPLIDVVFQLLIFFMLAGTVQKFELIPIDPPIAESSKVVDESEIVLLLGAHGEIIFNDELVDFADIAPQVKRQLSLAPERIITIKADASLSASKLIELMDAVKSAGGKNLSLLTQVPVSKKL